MARRQLAYSLVLPTAFLWAGLFGAAWAQNDDLPAPPDPRMDTTPASHLESVPLHSAQGLNLQEFQDDLTPQQPMLPKLTPLGSNDTPASSKAPLFPQAQTVMQQKSLTVQKVPTSQNPDDDASNNLQIEAVNPNTGRKVHISISSDELGYDSKSGIYTVSGHAYIIVPEHKTEVLADRATYDPKTANVIADGNVFVISDRNVIGSEHATIDLNTNVSHYYHAKTLTPSYRVMSNTVTRTDYYTIVHNGRFVMNQDAFQKIGLMFRRHGGMHFGLAAAYAYLTPQNFKNGFTGVPTTSISSTQGSMYNISNTVNLADNHLSDTVSDLSSKTISPRDVILADFDPVDAQFGLKATTVNIYRSKNHYDEIKFVNTTFTQNHVPIMYMPTMRFGYNEDNHFSTYLGNEIGYDADLGGFYAGPGWHRQILNGWLRFSPIISYGGGARVNPGLNSITTVPVQWGIGATAHFRSPDNYTDFGWDSTVRIPIFYSQERLNSEGTLRFRMAANQYFSNGFFAVERPTYTADIVYGKAYPPWHNLILRVYHTLGVAKDDFYPNRNTNYFVAPTSTRPITTVRAVAQAQVVTYNPLIRIGHHGGIGFIGETRLAAYGTGDGFGIVQAGPFFNYVLGPTLTQITYLRAQPFGHSPFVFDSYYSGQNSVNTVNSIDLTKFITVGAAHTLNLNRSNATQSLVVDRIFYVAIGPRSTRFVLAYDTIIRRSSFGLLINPEGGELLMDFQNLNLYQPDFKAGMANATALVVAPKRRQGVEPFPNQ